MPLNTPDIKELRAIVDWVNLAEDVREVSLKFGDVALFISRDRQQPARVVVPAAVAAPASPAAPAAPPAQPVAEAPAPAGTPAASVQAPSEELAADEVVIEAPMVGTFYASPKPGAPHFVSVGDTVKADTVLCIVEVMKLMSNVEAGVEGTVTRIFVEDNVAVGYGQPLMVVKRNG